MTCRLTQLQRQMISVLPVGCLSNSELFGALLKGEGGRLFIIDPC